MGDNPAHGVTTFLHVIKPGHDNLGYFGFRQQLHFDFRHHTQQPLGAGHQRKQVHPTAVQTITAHGHDITLGGDHFHAQDVVNGQTVLEAMHAARVLGHVTANGAGDLRGRIWPVIQTVLGRFFADGEVSHPGLQSCRSGQRINLHDAIELGQRQYHALLVGHGTGTESRSGSTGHHRYRVLVTDAHHPLHLFNGFRQHHQQRHFAIHRHAVAFVGLHGFVIGDDVVRVDKRPELLRQLGFADFRLGSHSTLWVRITSV